VTDANESSAGEGRQSVTLTRTPVKQIPLIAMVNNRPTELLPHGFNPTLGIFGLKERVDQLIPYITPEDLQRLMQAVARARPFARERVANCLLRTRVLDYEVDREANVALRAVWSLEDFPEALASRPVSVLACEHCLAPAPRFFCSKCHLAAYCQAAAWPAHKHLCAEIAAHKIRCSDPAIPHGESAKRRAERRRRKRNNQKQKPPAHGQMNSPPAYDGASV
jgi:hypothetical protein